MTARRSAPNSSYAGTEPCIASGRSRKQPFDDDKLPCHQRHKVENLFARPRDRRRMATRYHRCAHTSLSAICIPQAVILRT
ncbi:transposase [Aquamicrobium lusatiense]|uniref:transposase n=1 Tax=Aquamicrobium lusatiense TaxID=89772 RepID=UPI003CC7E098